jgi:hypothetical protein
MGEIPPGMTLDRINNDGDYCKENCKWSNPKEQMNNQRKTIRLLINGRLISLRFAAVEFDLHPKTIMKRLQLGWSDEDAVVSGRYTGNGHRRRMPLPDYPKDAIQKP